MSDEHPNKRPTAAGDGTDPDATVDTPLHREGDADTILPASDHPVRSAFFPNIAGYEMVKSIASGGMGWVFQARDTKLDRLVAIKVPRAELMHDKEASERFLREAKSAAKLRHANLCPIYEIGNVDGTPYIAMGFIDGPTLRQRCKTEAFNAREAAAVIAKLARAVDYAHQHGVIHRDIKPANVLMDGDTNEPILTDFGLAKLSTEADSQVTQTGEVVGTPAYMSPEQAIGNLAQIGPATDIYSLGALLYELLCGHPPFKGNVTEILAKLANDEPRAPRKVAIRLHRDLETICLKAISKRPEDRYGSALELAEDLERFSAGEAILARPQGLASKTWRRLNRNPVATAATFIVAAALIAAGIIASSGRMDRKVASLRTNVDELIREDEWSATHMRQIDRDLDELAQLDPSLASQLGEKATEKLESLIREILKNRMTEERSQSAQHLLALLGPRNSANEEELRLRFDRWNRDWAVAIELRPPFKNASTLFADSVRVDEGRLIQATGSATPDRAPLVLTNVVSPDNVAMEAEFDSSWQSTSEVGLILCANGDDRYEFVLRIDPSSQARQKQATSESGQVDAASSNIVGNRIIEIRRGSVALLKQSVNADELNTQRLWLQARRIGNALEFKVNRRDKIVIYDPFPLSRDVGVFGLRWPHDLGLNRLEGKTMTVSSEPTGIEIADRLYTQQDYRAALDEYQRLANELSGEDRLESIYKQALCLKMENRRDDALALFESLRAETGDRWPTLATVQAWLMYLQGERNVENEQRADAILDSFGSFSDLVTLIPQSDRDEILSRYTADYATIVGRLTRDPSVLERVSRAAKADKVLSDDGHGTWDIQFELLRIYRAEEDYKSALKICDELIANFPPTPSYTSDAGRVNRYRVLRLLGRGNDAIEEITAHLGADPSNNADLEDVFLNERVRSYVAIGDVPSALADLRYLEERRDSGHRNGTASLMHGILLRQRGFELEAEEQFRTSFSRFRSWFVHGYHSARVQALIAGALSGELTDNESDQFIEYIISQVSGSEFVGPMVRRLSGSDSSLQSALRSMWRTPRGLQVAHDITFETVTLKERTRSPLILLAYEIFRQSAFGDQLTAQQDALLWDFASEGCEAYFDSREMNEAMLLQLGFAWQMGSSVPPGLSERLHAQTAWVLGHRSLQLGTSSRAIGLFQDAVTKSPANSRLHSVASTDLKLLKANQGRIVLLSQAPTTSHMSVMKDGEDVAVLEVGQDALVGGKNMIDLEPGEYQLRLDQHDPQLQLNVAAASQVEPVSTHSTTIQVDLARTAPITLEWIWNPQHDSDPLPGLIPNPAKLPGIARWQLFRADGLDRYRGIHWSSNGKWIAAGNEFGHTRVFDAESLKLLRVLPGSIGSDQRVYFSPDSSLLAVADCEGHLNIWSTETWRHQQRIPIDGCQPWITWHPNGKLIAVVHHDRDVARAVRLDGSTAFSIEGYKRGSYLPSWNQDGSLMVCHDKQKIQIYDGATGKLLREQDEPAKYRSVEWINEPNFFATTDEKEVRIWDADTNKSIRSVRMVGFSHAHVQWHRETETLWVLDDWSGRVCYFDPMDESIIEVKANNAFGHLLTMAPGDDGRFARSHDIIRIYSSNARPTARNQRHFHVKHDQTHDLEWNPEGTRLAATVGRQIYLIDSNGRVLRRIRPNGSVRRDVCWEPGGERFATASYDKSGRVWSSNGKLLLHIQGHSEGLQSIHWHPKEQSIVTSSSDGTIRFWSLQGSPLKPSKTYEQTSFIDARWCPNGNRLAAIDHSGKLRIFDADLQLLIDPVFKRITAIRWSPDANRLAVLTEDSIRLLSADGKTLQSQPFASWSNSALAWLSKDEILVPRFDGRIMVWNASQKSFRHLKTRSHSASELSLTPNKRLLAIGGKDGAVEIYDMENDRTVATIIDYQESGSGRFSEGGKLLAGEPPPDDRFVVVTEDASGSLDLMTYSQFTARVNAKLDGNLE